LFPCSEKLRDSFQSVNFTAISTFEVKDYSALIINEHRGNIAEAMPISISTWFMPESNIVAAYPSRLKLLPCKAHDAIARECVKFLKNFLLYYVLGLPNLALMLDAYDAHTP
jgi:hypothetical protein